MGPFFPFHFLELSLVFRPIKSMLTLSGDICLFEWNDTRRSPGLFASHRRGFRWAQRATVARAAVSGVDSQNLPLSLNRRSALNTSSAPRCDRFQIHSFGQDFPCSSCTKSCVPLHCLYDVTLPISYHCRVFFVRSSASIVVYYIPGSINFPQGHLCAVCSVQCLYRSNRWVKFVVRNYRQITVERYCVKKGLQM